MPYPPFIFSLFGFLWRLRARPIMSPERRFHDVDALMTNAINYDDLFLPQSPILSSSLSSLTHPEVRLPF